MCGLYPHRYYLQVVNLHFNQQPSNIAWRTLGSQRNCSAQCQWRSRGPIAQIPLSVRCPLVRRSFYHLDGRRLDQRSISQSKEFSFPSRPGSWVGFGWLSGSNRVSSPCCAPFRSRWVGRAVRLRQSLRFTSDVASLNPRRCSSKTLSTISIGFSDLASPTGPVWFAGSLVCLISIRYLEIVVVC